MGIVCGFYRMSIEKVETLKGQPEHAHNYIDENYCWVNGKYHIEDDIVFETDKGWDIAKFLLKKCDTSHNMVLSALDGIKIDPAGDWDSPRYINSETVKQIKQALTAISTEQIRKAYNQDELVKDHVYRADWFDETDMDYYIAHIDTMRKAFSKAAEFGDCLVVHFH